MQGAGIWDIDSDTSIVSTIKTASHGNKPVLKKTHKGDDGLLVRLVAGHKLCKVSLVTTKSTSL